MHVNSQIRNLIVPVLKSGTSLRGASDDRAPDLLDADLPMALVATDTDTIGWWSKGTSTSEAKQLRTVDLTISVIGEGESEEIQAEVDAIRAELEPLVGPALAAIAREVRHTGAEMDLGQAEDGERWYAFLVLVWEVDIVTEFGKPEEAIL